MEKANTNNYDDKGNASHYDVTRLNTMFVFERTFGTEALMTFCEINALKYRMRIGHKDQPLDQELKKALWYEHSAKYLFDRLGTDDEIKVDNTQKRSYKI